MRERGGPRVRKRKRGLEGVREGNICINNTHVKTILQERIPKKNSLRTTITVCGK